MSNSQSNTIDYRQYPTDAFIEQLRQRFPTDAEVDAVLTRKMQNRAKKNWHLYTGHFGRAGRGYS